MHFGPLRTGTRHVLRDEKVEIRLCLEVTDLRTGGALPLPAGVDVTLLGSGARTRHAAKTDEHGCVAFVASARMRNVAILLELGDRHWLDLDAGELLREPDLDPLDRRPLVRLPAVWRSDEQARTSDDRGGRFAKGTFAALVQGGQGTEDEQWTLRIDHAWQALELAFVYFDPEILGRRKVTLGPRIEVFRGSEPTAAALVGAATVLDDQGLVRVRLFAPVEPPAILVRMRTPADTFVRMHELDPALRVARIGAAELAAMPLSARRRHYRLPEAWLSRGQFASLGNDRDPQPFATVVAGGSPVHVDLDDLVLVDETLAPIAFDEAVRLTIFDTELRIADPDARAPYFSVVDATVNHFAGCDVYAKGVGATRSVARVIRRGHGFYDVTGKRTTRGKIIGARAAVRSDHPIVDRPRNDLAAVDAATAELHYFADLGVHEVDGNERRLGGALVFVAFRIRVVAGQGVTEKNVVATQKELDVAARSWMCATSSARRDVLVRSRADDVDIRFVFHFVALERGRPHVNLFLWGHRELRAHALHRAIALDVDGDLMPETLGFDPEDWLALEKRTLQHEIGHSLGLDDEYFENLGDTGVPRLAQAGHATVYALDAFSIMNGNALPRLRHYWCLARWLTQHAAIPITNDRYEIVCDTRTTGGLGRIHHYALPAVARSPFAPVAGPDTLRRGAHGRLALELYLAGDDLDPLLDITAVDAILHASHGLYARFPENSNGDRIPEVTQDDGPIQVSRSGVLRDLLRGLRGADGGSREGPMYIAVLDESAPASALAERHARRVLVHFLPRFTYSNPAAADFRLHIRATTGVPAGDACTLRGRKLEITERFSGGALLCHMLGLPPRQQPRIEVIGVAVNGSITLESTAGGATLRSLSKRTSGDGSFVGFGEGNEGPGPLEPSTIATSIAEAINDPANDFGDFATATVSGAIVTLTPASAELELEIETSASGLRCRNAWRTAIEPDELQFLADWIGEKLGARYRIERHDHDA